MTAIETDTITVSALGQLRRCALDESGDEAKPCR
jgi:hypothetical protein